MCNQRFLDYIVDWLKSRRQRRGGQIPVFFIYWKQSGPGVYLPVIFYKVMKILTETNALMAAFFCLAVSGTVYGGDVTLLAADFRHTGGDQWSVNVTLEHADTGWDHYADNWRVVDGEGQVLGERVLQHPHVHEQPFTRGLGSITVPQGTAVVYVEVHDKLHGWSPNRLKVSLQK